ncbi:uncharacterized protein LOC124810404 [Hydra vulgaris]|uniref:uncharacterized protein LOC124810404 n=1 Tax=Hydra vulgaris TaxID=6087 RepID=UPI001F5FEFD8|nr:uncharacterized protein LOC124810404 [Hydra vulgaris]
MFYSSRCGIAKDKKKAGEKIKITTLDCPVVNVEEEVIIEDMDLDGLTSFNCNVPNKHLTPKEEFEKMIAIKDNSQELYVLNLCCPITRQGISTICNNEMLTDNIINAAQKMLLQQYPNTKGLQDPILGQNLSFAILKNEEFVQVLHDGCAHWFVISTVRCEPGHVFVMDSHFTGKLSHATMRQICSIIHCQLDKIKVTILPVQQQTNGIDCGIYRNPDGTLTLTLQYLLYFKDYPTKINFDETKLRKELLNSFQSNFLSLFSTTEKTAKRNVQKEISLDIYCTCRMIWVPSDKNIFGKHMVECSGCLQWFHRMCERISDDVLNNNDINWYCSMCEKITNTN